MTEENKEELKPGDEGYVAPDDDKKDFVPKTQFLAALRSANEKYDRLAAELAEAKKGKETPAGDKRYTRAELNAGIANKQITADQAEELWTAQLKADLKAEVMRDVMGQVGATTQQSRVSADLADYTKLAPEILEEGSEDRGRIAAEFKELVALGMPNNLTTELAAVRAVLGPLEKLRVAKSARRGEESHEETGSGGERKRSGPKTLTDTLSPREKDYYDGMIKKGMYKDWKAVEAELSFARPEVRRKAGARV